MGKKPNPPGPGDHVDRILEDWERERPDVDASPMAVVARISRAARYLELASDAVLRRFDLNYTTFGVLAALRRAGPPYRLSPSELYGSLLISSGTMTNRLDRLEAAGLVVRERDPRDRRGVLVRLTDRGLAVIEEALVAHLENEEDMLESLNRSQRDMLAHNLRRLLKGLETKSPKARLRDTLDIT